MCSKKISAKPIILYKTTNEWIWKEKKKTNLVPFPRMWSPIKFLTLWEGPEKPMLIDCTLIWWARWWVFRTVFEKVIEQGPVMAHTELVGKGGEHTWETEVAAKDQPALPYNLKYLLSPFIDSSNRCSKGQLIILTLQAESILKILRHQHSSTRRDV